MFVQQVMRACPPVGAGARAQTQTESIFGYSLRPCAVESYVSVASEPFPTSQILANGKIGIFFVKIRHSRDNIFPLKNVPTMTQNTVE